MSIHRKFLLVSLTATLLSTTVVGPASSGTGGKTVLRSFELHIGPVDAGSGYVATLHVRRPNGTKPQVNLRLSKTADFSASGIVSSATQTHSYLWFGGTPLTRVAADLSSAKVSTGELGGGYRGFEGQFVATAPMKKKRSCGSGLPLATARIGKFRSSAVFDTHTEAFGTIDFGGAKAMIQKVAWVAGDDACGKSLPSLVPPGEGIAELKPYFQPGSIHFLIGYGGLSLQADRYGEETHIEVHHWGAFQTSHKTSHIIATTNDPAAFTATSDLSSGSLDLDDVPFLNQSTIISGQPHGQYQLQQGNLTLSNSSWTGVYQRFDLTGVGHQATLDDPFTFTFDGMEPMTTTAEQVGNVTRLSNQ